MRDISNNGYHVTLLDTLAITTAISATAGTPVTGLAGMKYVVVTAKFVYGSGGTNATVYVQTSTDGGVTWQDIACIQFTTSTATKVSALSTAVALAAATTTTDGALTANTILNGLLGDRLRVKYASTGTYADSTSLKVTAIVKG